MNLIKCRFLKDGQPIGKAYIYDSPATVKPGDIVQINKNATGVVVEANVPEEEVEAFRDKVKSIVGLLGKVNAVVKNWSLYASNDNGFTAPELVHKYLQGNVYGRLGFQDGDPINTSRIVDIEDAGDHKVIVTRTGSRYLIYPEDISPECEKQFPGYYEKLHVNI